MSFVEKNFAEPIRHNPYLHKIVINYLKTQDQGPVLDLPSGPGYLIRDLKAMGFQGIAGEIDESLHCLSDVDYKKINMTERFDFNDERFSYVVSVEGIEHIENHFAFLREVRRVLKKGGQLILTTPNILSLGSRWNYFWSGFHTMASSPIPVSSPNMYFEHINPIAFNQLYFSCAKANLTVEKILTHRFKTSSKIWYYLFYPFIYFSTYRACFIREKSEPNRIANKRLFKFLMSKENLLGTHTIIIAKAT